MCLMSFSVLFSLLLLSPAAESEARQREMFSQEAKFLQHKSNLLPQISLQPSQSIRKHCQLLHVYVNMSPSVYHKG